MLQSIEKLYKLLGAPDPHNVVITKVSIMLVKLDQNLKGKS